MIKVTPPIAVSNKEDILKDFHRIERDGFIFHFMRYPQDRSNEVFIVPLDSEITNLTLPYGSAKYSKIIAGVKHLQYEQMAIDAIIRNGKMVKAIK